MTTIAELVRLKEHFAKLNAQDVETNRRLQAEIDRLRLSVAALKEECRGRAANEDKLRAALEPFANAAEKARKEKGDPAYGLRWDDFLRAQNCFTNDEQALKSVAP